MNNIQEHRISGNFNPENYQFVESFDNREILEEDSHSGLNYVSNIEEPMSLKSEEKIQEQGYSIEHCTHCGACLKSGNVWLHKTSGEFIIMGNTCSERTEFSKADFDRYYESHKLDLQKSLKLFKDNYKFKVIKPLLDSNIDLYWKDKFIVREIVGKMVKRRRLPSHKQIRLIRNIPLWNKQSQERKEAFEKAQEERVKNAQEWAEGRQEITGEVISIKDYEQQSFGYNSGIEIVRKIVVELEDGRRCFGTMPKKRISSYDLPEKEQLAFLAKWSYEKGAKISFKGTIKVSEKDKFFAFFSRPSLTKIS
jgi:hypothetical protein